MKRRPHIVMIIPRGEAVRNFVYSDTLRLLSERADVTLLSVITDPAIMADAANLAKEIIPLTEYPENPLVTRFRYLIHVSHFRWVWSEAVKYYWGLHDARAKTVWAKIKRGATKAFAWLCAHRKVLEIMTRVDNALSWRLCPNDVFITLFNRIKPDIVFNCSHIHGPSAELPLRAAGRMGIKTATFVFSWDNLTSRSRIFIPYNYYFVWTEKIKQQLLEMYPAVAESQVFATGTPQFDFHFKPEYERSREEICQKMGIDPMRPYVLYTTGMDTDFLDEHRIVEAVINLLAAYPDEPKPQLVVRTYIKGTSPQMQALSQKRVKDVAFPTILWAAEGITPMHEDLFIYSNQLRHAALVINAASTVSLEAMIFDKPVINLGLEPPGSELPYFARFSRHVEYEHYKPVADSGAVMVARSTSDLEEMIHTALRNPQQNSVHRQEFIQGMFDDQLDGNAGARIAKHLRHLAVQNVA